MKHPNLKCQWQGQGNVNEKIKELHKQGKSVLEISKQLNIGQGEVKLCSCTLWGG